VRAYCAEELRIVSSDGLGLGDDGGVLVNVQPDESGNLTHGLATMLSADNLRCRGSVCGSAR
jgi:hypothetical protein